MAHDAFISCSQQDKPVAEATCTILESSGIRCWVAPRDVSPGSQWAGSIVEAIDRCRVMILIFSSKANVSDQVHRELEQAVRRGKPIFPLRIEDVSPVGSMDYFLSAVHWLDALTPPIEKHLNELACAVRFHLDARQNGANPSRPDAQRQANVHPNATRANWVPVARNWAAPLAIFIGLAVGGVGTALYVMSEREPQGKPATQSIVPTTVQQQQTQQRLAFNETSVRLLARRQGIPLPQAITVTMPSAKVSKQFAGYLGAWGADQGWGGDGRNVILIVENIDDDGVATGTVALGPATQTTLPGPGGYKAFSGPLTNDGLHFSTDSHKFTFKRIQDDQLQGYHQFEVGRELGQNTIVLRRVY